MVVLLMKKIRDIIMNLDLKQQYFASGLIMGFFVLILIFLFDKLIIDNCAGFGCLALLWIILGPGMIFCNVLGINNIFFLGLPFDYLISLFFYFIIGFIIGLLIYRLYLIRQNE